MSINEVLDAVRTLSPEERAQVRELIDSLPSTPTPQMTEDEFEQYLAAKGVISLPLPMTEEERAREQAEFEAYVPIEVGGTPLSRMIIEERR